MNRLITLLLTTSITLSANEIEKSAEESIKEHYIAALDDPEAAIFVPPVGWLAAEPASLPSHVKALIVGKGEHEYPPSINLGAEAYEGSLKTYLKNIKMINEAQAATWKDLGQIATESGNASLSQVDMKTKWGDVRLMHAIIIRYGTAYILTASALKEEFSQFYKDFFQAMRSFKINKDVYEMVKNPEKRAKLQTAVQQLKKEWSDLVNEAKSIKPEDSIFDLSKELFYSETFQADEWDHFNGLLENEFADMGESWKENMCLKAMQELGL